MKERIDKKEYYCIGFECPVQPATWLRKKKFYLENPYGLFPFFPPLNADKFLDQEEIDHYKQMDTRGWLHKRCRNFLYRLGQLLEMGEWIYFRFRFELKK